MILERVTKKFQNQIQFTIESEYIYISLKDNDKLIQEKKKKKFEMVLKTWRT